MTYEKLTKTQQWEIEESVSLIFKEQWVNMFVRGFVDDDEVAWEEFVEEAEEYVQGYMMENFGINIEEV